MPRGVKCRRVCFEPENRIFSPEKESLQTVTITIEELEALRLVDKENLEQDKAAQSMNISRGTLQRILYSAHKKTALALTEGYSIVIGGGNYELSTSFCGCHGGCRKCRFYSSPR